MARVFLGLGSNLNARQNIADGIARLDQDYRIVRESPWYRSPALGFDGPDFINLVLEVECDCSLLQLRAELKQIEYDFGRPLDAVKFSSRSLDIDILLYNDWVGDFSGLSLPRSDIYECAFVLRPLLDIFPTGLDPQSKTPLTDFWPPLAGQPLYRIDAEGVSGRETHPAAARYSAG
ncbi:MAG: 2-amino-4-hydroxy-6-hydroxymethyldihydropteridine diphosphokinase [Oceanospirillaceae bacterium]|nr:2-amino-4-hydroxy-6-hydroxymethyldihydropteridine diphosphokinase [Oceanospirillaceae bacterium]